MHSSEEQYYNKKKKCLLSHLFILICFCWGKILLKKKKDRIKNCKEILENLWESWYKMCLVRIYPWALICHVHMAPNRAPAASTLNVEESFMRRRMTMDRVKKVTLGVSKDHHGERRSSVLLAPKLDQSHIWSCTDFCKLIYLVWTAA